MLMGQQLGSYTPSTHGNHWDTTVLTEVCSFV
jgi:hypothetical protein